MKVFFKKIPLALSSLVLALFSLSNQISQLTLIAQGIWLVAVFGFFLVLGRLIIGYRQTQEDLHNPVKLRPSLASLWLPFSLPVAFRLINLA